MVNILLNLQELCKCSQQATFFGMLMSVNVTGSHVKHVALDVLGGSHVIAAWCLHDLQMENRQVDEIKYTESVVADDFCFSTMKS